MADRPSVRLNSAGITKIMQQYGPPLLEAKAKAVVARIRADGYSADYQMGRDRNGRPVVFITLTHVSGLNVQVKHGTVTRAAAAEGLDINRYFIR